MLLVVKPELTTSLKTLFAYITGSFLRTDKVLVNLVLGSGKSLRKTKSHPTRYRNQTNTFIKLQAELRFLHMVLLYLLEVLSPHKPSRHLLVSWSVCLDFLKRQGSYTSIPTLLSEHMFEKNICSLHHHKFMFFLIILQDIWNAVTFFSFRKRNKIRGLWH